MPGTGPARSPRRRRISVGSDQILVSVLLGLGIGVGLYVARAPLGRAALIGLTGAAVILLVLVVVTSRSSAWSRPGPVDTPRRWHTKRWQLPGSDLLYRRDTELTEPLRKRLAAIATGELHRLGTEPKSPAARALLGDRGYRLLFEPGPDLASRRGDAGEAAAAVHRLLGVAGRPGVGWGAIDTGRIGATEGAIERGRPGETWGAAFGSGRIGTSTGSPPTDRPPNDRPTTAKGPAQ